MALMTSCVHDGRVINITDAAMLRHESFLAKKPMPDFHCEVCGRPVVLGVKLGNQFFRHKNANPECPYSKASTSYNQVKHWKRTMK